MNIERMLRLLGGLFVLVSLLLSVVHSRHWLWFTAFVGANLFQSGITDWCPMVWILEKAGMRRG
ncbi:MAG TPA: DUF2892 domain-containing protein [Candidatus Hydrogenedentes bacterium]|nr:DUF2892 domain-containing protein [Candidatus Hydrogenedentota bacterium]